MVVIALLNLSKMRIFDFLCVQSGTVQNFVTHNIKIKSNSNLYILHACRNMSLFNSRWRPSAMLEFFPELVFSRKGMFGILHISAKWYLNPLQKYRVLFICQMALFRPLKTWSVTWHVGYLINYVTSVRRAEITRFDCTDWHRSHAELLCVNHLEDSTSDDDAARSAHGVLQRPLACHLQ